MAKKESAEKAVRDIRRRTRRRFSAEEKILIVIEGLRGEEGIASLCRREGIVANLYYRWSKEFLEAGKKRLLGDTQREASSSEVNGLRKENALARSAIRRCAPPISRLGTRRAMCRSFPPMTPPREPHSRSCSPAPLTSPAARGS